MSVTGPNLVVLSRGMASDSVDLNQKVSGKLIGGVALVGLGALLVYVGSGGVIGGGWFLMLVGLGFGIEHKSGVVRWGGAFVGSLVLLAVIMAGGPGELAQQAQDDYVRDEMQRIENQVAQDAIQQYEIAKRGEDKIQTCTMAGMVSAAWLQAKNEAQYNKWKAIEKEDCKAAGLDFP